jgi:hypothetical protein
MRDVIGGHSHWYATGSIAATLSAEGSRRNPARFPRFVDGPDIDQGSVIMLTAERPLPIQ